MTIAQTLSSPSSGNLAKSQVHGRCSMLLDLSARYVASLAPRLFSAPGSPRHMPMPPSASAPCLLWSPSSPSRSPSPLLHPPPPQRTPASLSCLPHPPPCCCRLRILFPRSIPQLSTPPVLPAPILLGRASPPVAAAARSAASAARSRAARAMAGGDADSTPEFGCSRVGAGSPPRPGAPLAGPPSTLAAHSLSLDE